MPDITHGNRAGIPSTRTRRSEHKSDQITTTLSFLTDHIPCPMLRARPLDRPRHSSIAVAGSESVILRARDIADGISVQEAVKALRCEHKSDQTDTSVPFLTNGTMNIVSTLINWT